MRESDVVILRPKPTKLFLLAGISLTFTLVGIWILHEDPETLIAWLSVIFFGLCSIVLIFQLLFLKRNYLRLNNEGFLVSNPFGSFSHKWSDIETFAAGKIGTSQNETVDSLLDAFGVSNPPGFKTVVFSYSKSYSRFRTARKIVKGLGISGGHEGALSDTYGMTADELSNLMNTWRRRYTKYSD